MGEERLHDRMEKLESAHAFAEHTTEQLDAELRKAFDLIEQLHERLARLEQRINDVETAEPDPDEG
jgi:uncharacterized coiled-coil protein SlyX